MTCAVRNIVCSVLVAVAMLPLASFDSHAEIVSTQQALAMESDQARATVDAWLLREDVSQELASMGVDPELARIRAQSLNPEELAELSGRIDELPAGAGVIEVLGITFLVLLVLDLVGVINIFSR